MKMFNTSNSHSGLSSVETLYAHHHKVILKSKKGEEKSRILKINLDLKLGLTISTGKVLSLQITDDDDSTFFYSLLLSQDDFSILRNQQGLLVDFDHFPTQLIKLLEACRSPEFNRFILVLDEEDAASYPANESSVKGIGFLKVIETNNFKNLCHISLKVVQGSDTDVKIHMSCKIRDLTEKLLEEENKCRLTEGKLAEAMEALEVKTKELMELQLKSTEEKNNLRLEMSRTVSEEREKSSRLQVEWQQKLDMEKNSLAKQYHKQLSDLNEQINSLTFNNKNLYESKCQLETVVKEKIFRIEALEKQNHQLSQEVNLLRKQNTQLDQDYHEKDKMVVGLKTKLAVAEQELKDKAKFLEKQQELLKVANEQKTFLEEALNEKETLLQRKMNAVQTLTADLLKSNEIIAKLQTELAANRAKMKLRTDIALEQEKILEKKTKEITEQLEKIKELEEKSSKLTEEITQLQTHLNEANKRAEEKDVVIKKNENVINWLNRRLTESASEKTILSSSRSLADSGIGGNQSKPSICNLVKSWPPWLANSVGGAYRSQGDSTVSSNHINENVKLLATSDDQDKLKNSAEAIQNEKPETKRMLDSKYFPSASDKDCVVNSQASKGKWSKANSGRQQPSAYFPKKTVN